MSMIGTRERRRRGQLLPEQLTWIGAKLGRWTTLRADLTKLSDEEQRDLLDLVKKASASEDPDVDAFNPDKLGKRDRGKLERLVEKGSGAPNAFKESCADAAFRAEIAEIAKEAMKPERRPKWEEEGAVVLPKQWCFDFVRDGVLWVDHVGLLVTMLAWFESAELPPRLWGASFEQQAGDLVLVVDSVLFGLGAVSEEGVPGWKRTFDHLVTNNFFEVERRGKEWRIKLGSRTLAARKARAK
jgi:hypothetical protein